MIVELAPRLDRSGLLKNSLFHRRHSTTDEQQRLEPLETLGAFVEMLESFGRDGGEILHAGVFGELVARLFA